jgi:hypothetical protein
MFSMVGIVTRAHWIADTRGATARRIAGAALGSRGPTSRITRAKA